MGTNPTRSRTSSPPRSTSPPVCTTPGSTRSPVRKSTSRSHLRDRKLQRALMQFFKPENYFMVREALLKAGRGDLIGNGCDCLIPAHPPRQAIEAQEATGEWDSDGEYVHQIPIQNPARATDRGERQRAVRTRTQTGGQRFRPATVAPVRSTVRRLGFFTNVEIFAGEGLAASVQTATHRPTPGTTRPTSRGCCAVVVEVRVDTSIPHVVHQTDDEVQPALVLLANRLGGQQLDEADHRTQGVALPLLG